MSNKVLIGITALITLAFVAGCGDKKEEKGGGGGGGAGANKPAEASSGQEVKLDPATAGTIKGICKFGSKPEKMPGPIDMGAKAKECATEGTQKMEEFYVAGENDAAANVVVFVKSGPATKVKTPAPSTEVEFDQHNCIYTPHTKAIRAGQPVKFKSSDNTSHNIHLSSALNGDWNNTMGALGSFLAGEGGSQKISNAEIGILLKCDIHAWMKASLSVFNHDYFQVTTKDGTFELKNLPPGDYEIEVWHESAKAKSQKVTVGAKETKELTFSLKFP